MTTVWSQMTTAEVALNDFEGVFENQSALLVTSCQSLHDATHMEGPAPSSTDKRLAIELVIVRSRTTAGEPRKAKQTLRWIDARYQIADCLTKHASRKSEE